MVYIFLATILYGVAITVAAFASRILNTNLVAAISNLFSALVPMLVVIPLLNKTRFKTINSESQQP